MKEFYHTGSKPGIFLIASTALSDNNRMLATVSLSLSHLRYTRRTPYRKPDRDLDLRASEILVAVSFDRIYEKYWSFV
jgi:hypothetical protein